MLINHSSNMSDSQITVGSKVLIANSTHKEFIGLCGIVTKGYGFKPEYIETFGTDQFFRVKFDSPISDVLPPDASLNDIFSCIEKHAKEHNIDIKFEKISIK